jgi:hypothetical protein
MVWFYAVFFPSFSNKLAPLDGLEKRVLFRLEDKHQLTIGPLKMAFGQGEVMQILYVEREFVVVTDVGSEAMYTVLDQVINGELPPFWY